ncbi:hypothetical protein [Methylobacterium sp. WL116]|uniref:hypothetical protein n=1 Tax=Methylobacterium sp. WL116 TaxID=2603889 RepID=UPI001FEFEA9F
MRKSDRIPSEAAIKAGFRYFRSDQDVRSQHFKCEDVELESKTEVGEFTIDELDLNSGRLRRLRDIRKRLTSCSQLVEEGVIGLRNFELDQLPHGVRGQALSSIGRARSLAEDLLDDIDTTLRRSARSQMIDPDDSADAQERANNRVAKIKAREGLFPGNWRAPRTKRK